MQKRSHELIMQRYIIQKWSKEIKNVKNMGSNSKRFYNVAILENGQFWNELKINFGRTNIIFANCT